MYINANEYSNPVSQAAAVASNLAEMARDAVRGIEHTVKVIGDAKKGSKVVHVAGLDMWVAAYSELMQDGHKKAAGSVKSTLNTATGDLWENGRLSFQSVKGEYVLVMSPVEPESEEEEKGEQPSNPLIEAAKELVSVNMLTQEQQEVLAALLREAADSI